MTQLNQLLKQLPKIDGLLLEADISDAARLLGRGRVTDICREHVARAKSATLSGGTAPDRAGIIADILADIAASRAEMVGRVINGTGVMLHTNLGRAPLGEALFDALKERLSGYCNLEINVRERRRGLRGPGVTSLLRQACDAEDAIVVNNNAAALFLILSALAKDKAVIVSRGELVQIGGGFRIPDILRDAGARLKEVGTTNITTIKDYQDAVSEDTALILKVHQANFAMQGFVSVPSVQALRQADLGGLPIVADLGSGNLVRRIADHPMPEPTPADMLRSGADLVCFSTDKMLGAGQGGVIAGSRAIVQRLAKHPVMRVVRVDKVTLTLLQTVLGHHLAERPQEIPLWSMAGQSAEALGERVTAFIGTHQLDRRSFSRVACASTFGGGATPGEQIPSSGLAIAVPPAPDHTARFLQRWEPPVVGTIKGASLLLDFRTIFPADEAELGRCCRALGASAAFAPLPPLRPGE